MKEHKIILEDLRDYMWARGVKTRVFRYSVECRGWFITSDVGYHYSIFDGSIGIPLTKDPIVSLSDPKYREKFCFYLGGSKISSMV